MTFLAIEELIVQSHSIVEVVQSLTLVPVRPDPPKQIGFCSNTVSRQIGLLEPCSNRIFDNDLDAFEMPAGKWICGSCMDQLLTLVVISEQVDSHKNVKRSRSRRKADGTSPRLPKGEDLR